MPAAARGPRDPSERFDMGFAFMKPFRTSQHEMFQRLAASAEAAGMSMVSTGDSPALNGDVFIGMTLLAQATSTAKVACLVTSPFARHPVVVANAVSTVNELSGGRAVLGISSGDSGVYNLGGKAAKLAEVEDFVRVLRELWRDGESQFRDTRVAFTWSREPVPIYMTPGGPRSLELAGKIADGVVIQTGLLPEVMDDALEHLERGARAAHRSIDDIDIWWYAKGNFGPSAVEAALGIASGLASSANHTFRFTMKGKQVPPELEGALTALRERYDYRQHVNPSATSPNALLVDELGLTRYLSDRFGIVGTPQDWLTRLAELRAHGVRQVAMVALMPDPEDFLRTFTEAVAPSIAITASDRGAPR